MGVQSFAERARNSLKSVVQIHCEGFIEGEIETILNPDVAHSATWCGSGFFVQSSLGEGYILTNAHVVRNTSKITIMSMLTSEELFEAEIVGVVKDLEPDIALICLREPELKRFEMIAQQRVVPLDLNPEANIQRGFPVKAIGYPLGMVEPNITGGEVTNFIAGSMQTSEKYVTDAAINPGNSGGPAISEDGKVIGINTAIIREAENIGFITPISFASIIIENLMSHNELSLADLGADLQKNSEALARYFNQPQPLGVVISRLYPGGTLEQAGLQVHDIILKINEYTFDRHGIVLQQKELRHENIYDVVKLLPLRKEFKITYWRSGKELISYGTALVPPEYGVSSNPIIKERRYIKVFGIILQKLDYEIISCLDMTPESIRMDFVKMMGKPKSCVVVTSFETQGQGDRMEWTLGEVITHINEKEVYTLEDVRDGINQALEEESSHLVIQCLSGHLGYFNLTNVNKIKIRNHRRP